MCTPDRSVLEQLVDVEEIKQLKARYFRTLDKQDWVGFAKVFASDAVLEVPEADLTTTGRDAITASVSELLKGATTVHHGHMPEIRVVSADYARGTWAMSDYVEWPSDDPSTRVGIRGYGHYIEEYVREGGQWRISRSRLERLRVDSLGALPVQEDTAR